MAEYLGEYCPTHGESEAIGWMINCLRISFRALLNGLISEECLVKCSGVDGIDWNLGLDIIYNYIQIQCGLPFKHSSISVIQ